MQRQDIFRVVMMHGVDNHLCDLANKLLSILVCSFECIGTALNAYRCLQAMRVQRKNGSRLDDSVMFFMLREGSFMDIC